jgi:hypothetical protein
MLHMLFTNNMVIVSSNKMLVNKSKNDDNVNSALETFTLCPSCKSDNAIISDPKSGEIICSRCGMVVSDNLLESRQEWHTFDIDKSGGRARTGKSINKN